MKGSAWTDAPPLWRGVYIDLQHCRTGKIFKRLQAASAAEVSELISYRWGFLVQVSSAGIDHAIVCLTVVFSGHSQL